MGRGFELYSDGDLPYYRIPLFENTGQVVCAFTTRHGGVSLPPYDSLNLAYHVEDNIDLVRQNRRVICAALGIDATELVVPDQVHGDVVKEVVAADKGQGAWEYDTAIPATDAVMTNVRGVPLLTCYADCVPVFLMDPVKEVIALAHAGWKGTVLQIGRKTVERMQAVYGCEPGDMIAGIGPSIGPCCFEVDDNVLEQFKKSFPYWADFTEAVGEGKWRIDLWSANRRQLLAIGLPYENIAVAGICTNCHEEQLFSYRAGGGRTGRMGAFLMLK